MWPPDAFGIPGITLTFVRGLRVRVEAPPVLDVNLPKEGAAGFDCNQTSSV